jgi:hypothetical protein
MPTGLCGGHAYVQCCIDFFDSARNMRISTREHITCMMLQLTPSLIQMNAFKVYFKKHMPTGLCGGHAYVQCCIDFFDSVTNMRIATGEQFTYIVLQ